MTRKDYKAIAAALYALVGASPPPRAREMGAFLDVVRSISDVMAEDNPRFDRARFFEAAVFGKGL